MKCAILAGGLGSRLGDATQIRPKPMVDIGGRPILWHIMKHYEAYGITDFVIALGYQGDVIRNYFLDYHVRASSFSVATRSGKVDLLDSPRWESWQVDLIETGLRTQTGGRIKRLRPFLGEETFMLTWGDGVSDVDLAALLRFHRAHGRLATVTAVRPVARFGHLELEGSRIIEFSEKPQTREGWINGAFFVLEPGVFEYIEGDRTHWEREPMEALARDGELMAFRHEGFWQCMDTPRDRVLLENLWQAGNPPWRSWADPSPHP